MIRQDIGVLHLLHPLQIEHTENTTEIVGVGEVAEARVLLVQRFYTLHIRLGKREVEDVKITLHALFVHGFRNSYNAALY